MNEIVKEWKAAVRELMEVRNRLMNLSGEIRTGLKRGEWDPTSDDVTAMAVLIEEMWDTKFTRDDLNTSLNDLTRWNTESMDAIKKDLNEKVKEELRKELNIEKIEEDEELY
jgi:hypothetical protein